MVLDYVEPPEGSKPEAQKPTPLTLKAQLKITPHIPCSLLRPIIKNNMSNNSFGIC